MLRVYENLNSFCTYVRESKSIKMNLGGVAINLRLVLETVLIIVSILVITHAAPPVNPEVVKHTDVPEDRSGRGKLSNGI